MQKLTRLFIIALFGSIIFVINVFLPPPINYLLMVVQAVLLALSALFIRKIGASYVGALGGLLTALGNPSLGPFTFFFAFLFGVLVDASLLAFRIRASTEGVNRNRLITAMAFSTLFIAVITYSTFVIVPQAMAGSEGFSNLGLFIPRSPVVDMLVIFMGTVSGAVAGYAAAYLWNRCLRNIYVR